MYRRSVFLPKSAFGATSSKKAEDAVHQAITEDLYKWQVQARSHKKPFVIHDGPPFANGQLHMGHALNKILKDTINRYRLMRGDRISFVPGWDCHGLPIEIKVNPKNDISSPIEIRRKAKEYALNAVEDHKRSFKSWGVMGEWDKPYLTCDPSYESKQVALFYDMYAMGLIYRSLKPVYWSPSSKTALAEAELEYKENHQSNSAFVKFPVHGIQVKNGEVFILIWTTTAWTIPANLAIAFNPSISYVLVKNSGSANEEFYVIGESRKKYVEETLGISLEVVEKISTNLLESVTYQIPFASGKNSNSRILSADFVSDESGTGLVHLAPDHGLDDYSVCIKNGINEFLALVGDDGTYNDSAGPSLRSLNVLGEGSDRVLGMLKENGLLLGTLKYTHKYPYDWRTKKPIIVRSTKQWFAKISSLVPKILSSLERVKFVPETGKDRLKSMIISRQEWCISRQRHWGVPIPLFLNGDEIVYSESIASHVCKLLEKQGSDIWWNLSSDELLPKEYQGRSLSKVTDTLDVWFDSGSSWASLTSGSLPDLYLEGSDQYRGWFQSSLITSVAKRGEAPFKAIINHGFVVDSKGHKMSKSIGNIISPDWIVNGGKGFPRRGIDGLRAWACTSNFQLDIAIGKEVLETLDEHMKKIRNTIKFALGNLSNAPPDLILEPSKMKLMEKLLLRHAKVLSEKVQMDYDGYRFGKVILGIYSFCSKELAFYLKTTKDTLYCDALDSHSRRSCVSCLLQIADILVKAMAPITPYMSEEAFGEYKNLLGYTGNVFQSGWFRTIDLESDPLSDIKLWNNVFNLVESTNRPFSELMKNQEIQSALQLRLYLYVLNESEMKEVIDQFERDEWCNLFGVSKVIISFAHEAPKEYHSCYKDCYVKVEKIEDHGKCERCWKYLAQKSGNDLCKRCYEHVQVDKIKYEAAL